MADFVPVFAVPFFVPLVAIHWFSPNLETPLKVGVQLEPRPLLLYSQAHHNSRALHRAHISRSPLFPPSLAPSVSLLHPPEFQHLFEYLQPLFLAQKFSVKFYARLFYHILEYLTFML